MNTWFSQRALAMAACGALAATACTSGVGAGGGYGGNGLVWGSGADGTDGGGTDQGDALVEADESAGSDAIGSPEDVATSEDTQAQDAPSLPDVPNVHDVAAPKDTGTLTDVMQPKDTGSPTDVVKPKDTGTPTDVVKPNDIQQDVGVGTCGAGHDVQSLLACTEGALDFQLLDVTVTYVFPAGFLVFDASSSRGMMIYVGSTPKYPNPNVGDRVSLHVSQYASFNGQQEVTGSDGLQFVGTSDAAAMMLEVGKLTKSSFTEAYESRALTGKGLILKSLSGADGIVTTPNAGDVTLRLDGAAKLCAGAVFELKAAALTQHGTAMRLHVMNGAADLGAVDESKCGGTAPDDTSNWGFEQAVATDPPPGFLKVGAALNATRTTAQAHGGLASGQMTWLSADNQDLVAGYLQPVLPGQKAVLGMWLLDNDPAGKARLCLTFYKADKTTVVSNQFQSTYSVDGAAWAQRSYEYVVPAEAAFVRGFVRLYDEPKAWAGTATIYTDDWSLAIQ